MNELESVLQEYEDGRLSKEDFAEKKQAERQAVYDLGDQTTFEVAESGERFQQYLDVQAQFGRYSETNALLVLAQKPTATNLGDFDYWKSRGAFVKKGETGVSIIEPSGEYKKGDGTIGISYSIKKVFDISQVDTRKMEVGHPKQKPTDKKLLSALISRSIVPIVLVDEHAGYGAAVYDSEDNTIYAKRDMGFSETFQGLASAIVLAELSAKEHPSNDLHFTAYCASYMLCKKHGVDTKAFAFDTVPTALSRLDTPQEIRQELSHIRNIAKDLGERMERSLGQQRQGARGQNHAPR